MGKREETETTSAKERDSGRGRQVEDTQGGTEEDNVEGKYCMGGTDMEESASNSAEWIREDMDESASEEEADTPLVGL